MKPPACQFYFADFLIGTMMMSADEVGGYIRLLGYQWTLGSVPDDDAQLARLGGCPPAALPAIRAKFEKGKDGKLRNPRMEHERKKLDEYRAVQAIKARAGANARWHPPGKRGASAGHDSGNAQTASGQCPDDASSSSSSSSSSKSDSKTIPAGGKPPRVYPRNELLDALCQHAEATDPTKAQTSLWPKCAKALQIIKTSSPDVTPDEISRRAGNYRMHFDRAALTSTALASHWGRCENSTNGQHSLLTAEQENARRTIP